MWFNGAKFSRRDILERNEQDEGSQNDIEVPESSNHGKLLPSWAEEDI